MDLTEAESGFHFSSVSKESAWNTGELGSIPGVGGSSGEGNVNPVQYSCLENPMDRGTWRALVHGVTRIGHQLATKPHQQQKQKILGRGAKNTQKNYTKKI